MTQRSRRSSGPGPALGSDLATLSAVEHDGDPRALRGAILGLVERFLPHEAPDVDATWQLVVRDQATYTLHVRDRACFVSQGAGDAADATLEADAPTWARLLSGEVDGIAAFTAGQLEVSGDLNLALRLETMFRPGPRSVRVVRTTQTNVRGVRIESLVAGFGTPVILIHGLGASKVSFLPTFNALVDHHEVHAIDLPGFGESDKPSPFGQRYSMAWMAEMVHGYMVRNRLRKAYLVGNSMGGRIATEVALRHPRSVLGIVGLGPAVAFDEWQWAGPILRAVRGQWAGLAKLPLRREWIDAGVRDLFFAPDDLPPQNLKAAAEEFARDYQDRGYRLALFACARSLAAERCDGFWSKLCRLHVPSYWIWGDNDRLVSCRYADRVRECVPDARVEVWDGMGHVPQFEDPERTNAAILDFIAALEGDGVGDDADQRASA